MLYCFDSAPCLSTQRRPEMTAMVRSDSHCCLLQCWPYLLSSVLSFCRSMPSFLSFIQWRYAITHSIAYICVCQAATIHACLFVAVCCSTCSSTVLEDRIRCWNQCRFCWKTLAFNYLLREPLWWVLLFSYAFTNIWKTTRNWFNRYFNSLLLCLSVLKQNQRKNNNDWLLLLLRHSFTLRIIMNTHGSTHVEHRTTEGFKYMKIKKEKEKD